MKDKPISIENRWDILYSDYPEVYDEFANVPYEPEMIDVLREIYGSNIVCLWMRRSSFFLMLSRPHFMGA